MDEDVLLVRELRSPPGHWGLNAVIWRRSTFPADIAVLDAGWLAPGAGVCRGRRCSLVSAAGEAGQDDAGGHHAPGDGGRLGESGGRLGVALLGALPGLLRLLGPASGPSRSRPVPASACSRKRSAPAAACSRRCSALALACSRRCSPGLLRLRARVDPGGELTTLAARATRWARSRSSICSGLSDPDPAAPAPSVPELPACCPLVMLDPPGRGRP